MKTLVRVMYPVVLALLPIAALSDDPDKIYWYEVSIKHGTNAYEFYGSSALSNEEFIEKMHEKDFVRLDNLMFRRQSAGKTVYSNWKEWDPIKKNYIYLRTKWILAVHPLLRNPETTAEGK